MTTQAEAQAELTAAKVAALVAAYEAAEIPHADWPNALSIAVMVGKIAATRLADLAISTLTNLPPIGLSPGPQHLDRLTEAVQTVLSEPETASERLETLAVAEVLTSEQKSLTAAIRAHGFAHWREDVAADACEVCQPFRDRIHPAEEAFEPHHPRCRCKALPHGERESLVTMTKYIDYTRETTS